MCTGEVTPGPQGTCTQGRGKMYPVRRGNYRVIELLENPSEVIKFSCYPSIAKPTLKPSDTSTCLFNRSRGGDSTAFLDSLIQCLTTLSVKYFY